MTFRATRIAGAAAMAAALSMAAAPAAAAELPAPAAHGNAYTQVNTGDAGEADGWRRYRRHRHRGIDAGDVIAGVVVVGALAALIGSANRSSHERDRYEDRPVRYDERRDRGRESRGIENAIEICVDQVEYRDNRVDRVDRADRDASGWTVSGTLLDGERWTCFIDNAGSVRSIDYGSAAYSLGRSDDAASSRTQLSDAHYARARATMRTPADDSYSVDKDLSANDLRPAYPGGPLPGEEGYEADWQIDGDLGAQWGGDGRYTTAQAPDFEQRAR